MQGLRLVYFLCLIGFSWAGVQVLTDDSFDSFVQKNELVLVEFYAPWCGHCKRLEPEYNKAAEELEELGDEAPILAKVDATVEKGLGERFEIQGYPTLKLFRSGSPNPYEGGRTAADIVGYLKKQMGPAIKPLASAEALSAFIPDDEKEPPVVVAFAEEGSDVANFISQFAKKFRDDYSFGLVSSAEAAGENTMGTIVLFKPFDELKNVFSGELEEEELGDFLKAYSAKAVDEIGPGNYAAYLKRALPISWMFIDPEAAATEDALKEYRKIAPEFKAKLSLVYLNGVQYKQMATKLGLSGEVLPGITIDKGGEHYVFPEGEPITEEALREWYGKFVKGELPRTVKSEPIPASLYDENNVATIVGDNFEEVVMDDTKDVFVEFYAPWCGHCKSLVPVWNQLGTKLKGVPSVVIAKTDATANDYPSDFQVSGFPTLKLVTSKGNKVIQYPGDRKLEAFIDWLQKNAGTPFEIPEGSEGGNASDDDEEDNDEL